MIYLFLAIACSASIALIFKYSEISGLNRYAVTSVNYVMATLIAGLFIWLEPVVSTGDLSFPILLKELGSSAGGRLTPESSLLWALTMGGLAGIIFFLSFVYYQISVKREGVALAGAFAKLGILLPMALSLVLWGEMPRAFQWLGMGLAVVSIVLVNWPAGKARFGSIKGALILLFLFGGLAEFSNKVFQKYAIVDFKAYFLIATFGTACVWSLFATMLRRKAITSRDVLLGCAVGVPNLFSSFFLIQALETVPAAVAFPIFGAGTIFLITIVGATFYRERMSLRDKLAIGLIAVAIILINI